MSDARILIVDDDDDIRYTVKTVLDESGLPARAANGGQEALEVLRGGFRGLIFLDVMMPGMDGWETLEAMARENLTDGQVICMLTALQDPAPQNEELKQYVIRYVKKPFDFDDLVEMVRGYLEQMDR